MDKWRHTIIGQVNEPLDLDAIAEQAESNGLDHIETIGDGYMCYSVKVDGLQSAPSFYVESD